MDWSNSFQFTFFIISNWHQILMFVCSWLAFYVVGLLFLDIGIGQYHSSYLKRWVVICKALFLSTFVIACTLLELLTFEILDIINPLIRQFVWTASFSLLCVILNILIPGVLAATVCVHFDIPHVLTCVLSLVSLLVFHTMTLFLKVFLPLQEAKKDDIGKYSTKSGEQFSSSSVSDLFGFNFQTSISLIAIVGTVIAAVIAGFATVSFPIEQLANPLDVSNESLKDRQIYLLSVVQTIVRKKKMLVLLRMKAAGYRKAAGAAVDCDIETSGAPFCSPQSQGTDSTPLVSPQNASTPLSMKNNYSLSAPGWAVNMQHRHTAAGTSSRHDDQYSFEEISESGPSTPVANSLTPTSQYKYVGFGRNYHHDSSSSLEEVRTIQSSSGSISSNSINAEFGGFTGLTINRNSIYSWFSYSIAHAKLRMFYHYSMLARWCKGGCSLIVAFKCLRMAIVSSIARVKFLSSSLYKELRGKCCGVRSKPRHVSPMKAGNSFKCAACVNKAFCEHYAPHSSWMDVSLLVCNNTWLWVFYRFANFVKQFRKGVFYVIALVKLYVLGIEAPKSSAEDDDDDVPLFPTSQNRQVQRHWNEVKIVQQEIDRLEDLCDALFLEQVCMRESLDKVALSATYWGMMMRVSGQYVTVVGLFRFVVGLWRVGCFIMAGRYVTVSQQADNVSSVLEFIVLYLRLNVDLEPWSPILGAIYIACMTLLHIRAFIISTEQFAKLGVLSTSTEIYSLVLAYLAGSYSVAGVMFLRTQLPRYRRKAVTAALGENIVYDFYFWLFDVIFLLATVASCCYFFFDIKKKKRISDAVSVRNR